MLALCSAIHSAVYRDVTVMEVPYYSNFIIVIYFESDTLKIWASPAEYTNHLSFTLIVDCLYHIAGSDQKHAAVLWTFVCFASPYLWQ